jgi:hypothetical protein
MYALFDMATHLHWGLLGGAAGVTCHMHGAGLCAEDNTSS